MTLLAMYAVKPLITNAIPSQVITVAAIPSPVVSPHKGSAVCNLDVLFYVRVNELFNKQLCYQWVEISWHTCDVIVIGLCAICHYSDVIMSAIASQITGVSMVCSTVSSDAGQRKHYSFASLAFVSGIHQWPAISPHKGPVMRKMFQMWNSLIRRRVELDFKHGGCHANR